MAEQNESKPQREIVYVPAPGYGPSQDDEIDLLELWDILWQRKGFIIAFTLLCTIAAVLMSLYGMTPKYKATASIQATSQSKGIIVPYLQSNKLHRELIEKYDLLPVLFSGKWDEEQKEWIPNRKEDIPTMETALAMEDFPLAVSSSRDSQQVNLTWTGESPDFCARMLEKVIDELRAYLQDGYQTAAQERIRILREELQSLKQTARKMENPDQQMLASIAGMQSTIAELKGQDVLARRFTVMDDPIPPQYPFEPNKRLIVGLTLVASFFVAVFLAFFARFVQHARERKRSSG